MDALEFAKRGIDELRSRLAQMGNTRDSSSPNFSMTQEEIVKKFFDDQGLNFGAIDTQAILALAGATESEAEPEQSQPLEDTAIAQDVPQNG